MPSRRSRLADLWTTGKSAEAEFTLIVPRTGGLGRIALAALSLAAIVAGLVHLLGAERGIGITKLRFGDIPLTLYRPLTPAAPAPVVVVAHGFAGSQQLMQAFALRFAQRGYQVVTFDFDGHGRHPVPLRFDPKDPEASATALSATLDQVVTFARTLSGGDGRLALLGHSMATAIILRHATAHPDVAATIAVSLVSDAAELPHNFLVIDGALEFEKLKAEGLRTLAAGLGGEAQEGVTYGKFADGSARRMGLAPSVEHIGVLFSRDSLEEAADWLDRSFARPEAPPINEQRGLWLAVYFLGLIGLALPLSALLPRVVSKPQGAGLDWRRLLALGLLPAIATPLLLRPLPTGFLPLLLGDYLAVHFGLYGLLTMAGLVSVGRQMPGVPEAFSWSRFTFATLAVTLYSLAIVGLSIDRFLFAFLPIAARAPLIPVLFCGTAIYFLADEWLTRGPGATPAAYAVTKLCFLASLALAVAIQPARLFFLVIIIPAILIFFLVFGCFSQWAYRRTGTPLVGACANAISFAWALAVTFPIVG
jgi:pimeloyl-ACP methyl ester carboxylesterase